MVGKTISHYRIIEQVGAGGMGIVYKAEDTKLKRPVALKFLPLEMTNDPEAKERFIHEARAASALDHPNICTIHEIGETADHQLFIVMSYYQGQTLKELITDRHLAVGDVINIIIQIAEGLLEAHIKGIVHRDIKPANIMITEKSQIKIMDFGLAKLAGQMHLTRTGTTIGTVAYMSPEQALGQEVDQRSDIWSLGIVLYQMLTGQLPFTGEYEQAVIYSIINGTPRQLSTIISELPEGLNRIVNKTLEKDQDKRYQQMIELIADLQKLKKELETSDSLQQRGSLAKTGKIKVLAEKPHILVPGIVIILSILFSAIFLINHNSKVKWAREEALPEIERLRNDLNYVEAFNLAKKAEKYISNDPKFKEQAKTVISKLIITTDPPGANVYAREYSNVMAEWQNLGKTPIDSIQMPKFTVYMIKIEKTGYEEVIAVSFTGADTLSRKLFRKGTIPEGMVYVDDYWDENKYEVIKGSCGFFLDRYEVTNRQYKEFIDKGGYRKAGYWKNEFIKDGKKLTWEEAMALFTDKTGRPGPSTWEASDYPEGQDNYPVSGISWYEAAAYAEFAGKSLPTGDHWDSGAGLYVSNIANYFGSKISPLSNFNGQGPEPVGKYQGINSFGAYDMAGNVREWCWNATKIGRVISGGGWTDATYLYSFWNQLPPFDRSPENGFRCVQYVDEEKIPESAFRLIKIGEGRDFSKEEPVPENIFRIYKNQFLYDSTELKAAIEEKDESPEDWNVEKITFNAAYGNERIIAYLFLPKNAASPFQTLLFFPGSYAISEKDLKNSVSTKWFLDYVLKSGRAVMYPVYNGTFQRNDGLTTDTPNRSHQYTEWLSKWVKDLSRSIDYLETRPDIDHGKLGFYGHSWGGCMGGIIPAVEKRLSVSILVVGGIDGRAYPEADAINFIPRIKIPVLMLNARYDIFFSVEKVIMPFFKLLGTPENDKRLCIYETDHYVPKSEMIKETLNWLDRYWGPVK